MGVPMTLQFNGLESTITHGPSSAVIRTVPPVDNGGDGSSFSPTDLVGAALASCVVTTVRLVAAREKLTFEGAASAEVVKEMTPPPRRIASLALVVTMPSGTKPDERARLEAIALGCPVAKSLHPDVQIPMRFVYP